MTLDSTSPDGVSLAGEAAEPLASRRLEDRLAPLIEDALDVALARHGLSGLAPDVTWTVSTAIVPTPQGAQPHGLVSLSLPSPLLGADPLGTSAVVPHLSLLASEGRAHSVMDEIVGVLAKARQDILTGT